MVKFNFIVLFFICPLIYFAQKVNNVEASQQGQNIVVTYDLETEQPCTINLFISTNGGNTWQGPLKEVEGQVGPFIQSGKNSITFFVLNEFNELRGDKILFSVEASKDNKKLAGPLCAINSMVFPGWGTTKVSYGKKGLGRSLSFLSTLLIAIVSNNFSNKQYKAYLNETDQRQMNIYYNNANTGHQIALVSGGISASIYLYDIIWVFSKGIKNKKRRIYQ